MVVDAEPTPYLPEGRKPRRDDEFVLRVERLDPDGRALGRWGDYRVRLRRGVPGQLVHAQVTRRRRHEIEARALAVLELAPQQVTPRCVHFGPCGGCRFQDMSYSAQLEELRRIARDELSPIGPPDVEPVLGADEPWGYRNRMDFTFSSRRWRDKNEPEGTSTDFALGLHVPGRHRKVIDVQHCEIQPEEGNALLDTARRLAKTHELPPWDPVAHVGVLRALVLRKGVHTGELMVHLVTSGDADARVDRYAAELVAAHPEITTLVHSVTSSRAVVSQGEHERVLHGPGVIHEALRGTRFCISASSFFQTNTRQAERLLDVVAEEAALEGDEVVYDLYCGVGTLSLHLARRAGAIWGFELVDDAVRDAERNAADNGVTNCRFEAGDLAALLSPAARAARGAPAPDVCIADPPRAGMHKKVVRALRELAPRRLVYVSCHVGAAARDLEPLVADGYRVERARPIDLFPHTPHLECVLTLTR